MNLSSGYVELNCVVLITTTPRQCNWRRKSYFKAGKCFERVIAGNTVYIERLSFKMTKNGKTLPSIYCTPKIHKKNNTCVLQ